MSEVSALAAAIVPAINALALDLEECSVRLVGRRKLVKVVVDGDSGVNLDIVADVSRAIDDLIEQSGVLGGADWTLEVTSPGVERPLTLPRHWRRNVGRNVLAHFADGREALGRIMEYDVETGALVLQVKGANRKFNTTDITKAIVQVEFNRKIADSELDLIDDGSDPDVTDAEADFSESDEEA
jgi:ribosome maturation factor RimP